MKFLLSLIIFTSLSAFAQDTTEKTTTKTSDVVGPARSEVNAKDIDQEITDAKMRADSGSKSKYSGSLNLNYTGGSWDKPFSNERPNVDGGNAESTSLDGAVGVRYRLSKNDSLYLSTGISKVRPFDNQEGDEWEAKNLTLMYGSWYRSGSTQIRSSVMTYIYTEQEYRDMHYVATLAATMGTMNRLGKSRFNVGLTNYLSYTHFDDDYSRTVQAGPKTINVDLTSIQFDSFLDIRPTVQYKFSDRFNLYTSLGVLSFYRTRAAENAFDYEKADITQTIGAGIAVTRDFYLAPNVDFQPEDIRADGTSVNLSAIINVL